LEQLRKALATLEQTDVRHEDIHEAGAATAAALDSVTALYAMPSCYFIEAA